MKATNQLCNRLVACVSAVVIAGGLMVPSAAFADVSIDGNTLNQGVNDAGGGTATLTESVLDMVNVSAETMFTDEDLSINYNGGNEIGEVTVGGSAAVAMNFKGENEVEEVSVYGNANVAINADGHNEFEEVTANENATLTINVTSENDFETIEGNDNASIAIRGTTCQKRDIINLGEDENDAALMTDAGNLAIDHVTVNVKAQQAMLGSVAGNVVVNTSRIGSDDESEMVFFFAGGTMDVRESVIDIIGSLISSGKMTIDHSDAKVAKPGSKYENQIPYRMVSYTGIDLLREKNGTVKTSSYVGEGVWYVDTDDNDGVNVNLEADGAPDYYRCGDGDETEGAPKAMPKTGDGANPFLPITALSALVAAAAFVAKRREEHVGGTR